MTSIISSGARSGCPCYTDNALCRLALLGVIYLISSMIGNQYKREGLRLWLYRCSWGKSPHPHLDPQRRGPQGRTADTARDLPAPQLGGQGDQPALLRSRPHTYTGVWLQLLLSAELVGTSVQLPPAMVDSGWFSDRKETSSIKSWELLQRNYLELHWIMKHLIFTNC
jgi:hypothetical protein